MDNQERIVEMLSKQEELLNKLTRPYIIADVYPRRFVNMLYFRIRNVGGTPAYGVKVEIDPPISIRKRISSELNIFQKPIPVLGPNEEISFFFDSAIELFNQEVPPAAFSAQVNYHDIENTVYEESILIDIELFKDLALELPSSDKEVETLERIQKELEKISRYTDDLRNRQLREEWLRAQEEENNEGD